MPRGEMACESMEDAAKTNEELLMGESPAVPINADD